MGEGAGLLGGRARKRPAGAAQGRGAARGRQKAAGVLAGRDKKRAFWHTLAPRFGPPFRAFSAPLFQFHPIVKITIPRHTLFGLLLRSPWWVSIMLALALAAVLGVFIPREYALFALAGTFPLLMIGLLAFWQQWRTPSDEKRAQALEQVRHMGWDDFAQRLTHAWRVLGVHASASEHRGADWRIAREGQYTLVYARRWKASVHGLEPVRQLAAAMHDSGIGQGLYLAAGGEVSPSAQRFAREHNIQIWLGDELSLLLLGKQPE